MSFNPLHFERQTASEKLAILSLLLNPSSEGVINLQEAGMKTDPEAMKQALTRFMAAKEFVDQTASTTEEPAPTTVEQPAADVVDLQAYREAQARQQVSQNAQSVEQTNRNLFGQEEQRSA